MRLKDPDLKQAIQKVLNLVSGEITPEDLGRLTELNVHYKFIQSLEGLELAVNLQKLVASGNSIEDITPLAPLVNLRYLDLHWCRISELAPLTNLRNLQSLYLYDNHIFHIDALQGLKNLEHLQVDQNIITDLKPLQGLTNLRTLIVGGYTDNPVGSHTAEMYGNPYWDDIKDISPLSSLIKLEYLCISDHGIESIEAVRNMKDLEKLVLSAIYGPGKIRDLAPLAELPKLHEVYLVRNSVQDLQPLLDNPLFQQGAKLNVESNPLSIKAKEVQIPALKKRGVIVEF